MCMTSSRSLTSAAPLQRDEAQKTPSGLTGPAPQLPTPTRPRWNIPCPARHKFTGRRAAEAWGRGVWRGVGSWGRSFKVWEELTMYVCVCELSVTVLAPRLGSIKQGTTISIIIPTSSAAGLCHWAAYSNNRPASAPRPCVPARA